MNISQLRSRELWFTAPGCVELRLGTVPAARAGTILVQAQASGVSQGTELLLFRGEGPTPFDPSLDVAGLPTYPRRYGYAWVGEVIDRAPDVTSVAIGERVFALAPHGDIHVLDAGQVRPIGRAIPETRAVMAANLETAVNCVWDSRVSLGDKVVILGAGIVGLLSAWLCVRIGAQVLVVEPSERRRAAAHQLGVWNAIEPDSDILKGDADLVIEASGNPAALGTAIEHAGHEATIVVVSFYGARSFPVALGEEFHRRRLTLKSSQVSHIAAERSARWTPERRFELVRRLLEEPQLDVLLDNVIDFAEAPDTYPKLNNLPGNHLQTVFTYQR